MPKYQIISYYRISNISFLTLLRIRVNDSTRSKAVRVILLMVLWKALRLVNGSTEKEVKQ